MPLFTAAGSTRRSPGQLSATAKVVAHQSVGGAYGVAAHCASSGQHVLAQLVHNAAGSAFVHGISIGCLVSGCVALAGAVLPAPVPARTPSSSTPAQPIGLDGTEAHARQRGTVARSI